MLISVDKVYKCKYVDMVKFACNLFVKALF